AGFDGWILKPIDFPRLSVLLTGIVDKKTREDCFYQPGQWEQGGWFENTPRDPFGTSTAPSPSAPVASSDMGSAPPQSADDPITSEQERLDSLKDDAVHARSRPEDPGRSGDIGQAPIPGAADLPHGGDPGTSAPSRSAP
ncbi:MAG: hypothetical protein Q9183_007708, partial [Haloplaca sp. 2 TL-2023]